MGIEITIFAVDDYDLSSITNQSEFFAKYLFEDSEGHISLESDKLNSFDEVQLLIKFLFRDNTSYTGIYKSNSSVILDLTCQMLKIMKFDDLDNFYQEWIFQTGRENTMDEYGMLLGFVGYIQRNIKKKFLLFIIDYVWSNENDIASLLIVFSPPLRLCG